MLLIELVIFVDAPSLTPLETSNGPDLRPADVSGGVQMPTTPAVEAALADLSPEELAHAYFALP
jgi:hypothetical protein